MGAASNAVNAVSNIPAKIRREAERVGYRINREGERVGYRINKEAERVGYRVNKEAETGAFKFNRAAENAGYKLNREAERIGYQINREAERLGNYFQREIVNPVKEVLAPEIPAPSIPEMEQRSPDATSSLMKRRRRRVRPRGGPVETPPALANMGSGSLMGAPDNTGKKTLG